jgi:hypothetical protein
MIFTQADKFNVVIPSLLMNCMSISCHENHELDTGVFVKSRRLRLAWHVACMGRRGMHIGFWWESQKGRDR